MPSKMDPRRGFWLSMLDDNQQEERQASKAIRITANSRKISEFIHSVEQEDIQKQIQCQICLDIMRKTKAITECMHRFCGECIDKEMQLKMECPICRKSIPSLSSLEDDPGYDVIISAIFPDTDKNEEERLTSHEEAEERRTRNREIEASCSQTFRWPVQSIPYKARR